MYPPPDRDTRWSPDPAYGHLSRYGMNSAGLAAAGKRFAKRAENNQLKDRVIRTVSL